MTNITAWRDYQEEAASFFRELGLEAETDARVEGVRTAHDVDVLVTFNHAGLSLKWLVECKHWKRRVSKLHVLGLREMVSDVGADRGILLAEKGFQSGASEAAGKSNVSLTSLAGLRRTASDALNHQRLNAFPLRLAEAHIAYWSIAKSDRIDLGIRPDLGDIGFHGGIALMIAQDVLLSALAGKFPPYGNYAYTGGAEQIVNLEKALNWLESGLSELEKNWGHLRLSYEDEGTECGDEPSQRDARVVISKTPQPGGRCYSPARCGPCSLWVITCSPGRP